MVMVMMIRRKLEKIQVCSVERLELIGLHGSLVFVQVRERVLGPVVVGIVVGIDCLRLQASDGIKLLDCCSTQPGQSPEDCPLNFCHLRVLHGIYQCVLCLCCMVLQLLGRVLFAKRRNLVEVHLKVMRHLLCQLILGSTSSSAAEQSNERGRGELHCNGPSDV